MSTAGHMTASPARVSRRGFLNVLSAMFMAASLFFFGHAAWIFAKAQLAQVLLEHAFDQSLVSGHAVKAWNWADTWPVARIRIDRIGAEAIVLKGTSGEAMAFGPGWVNETARPGEPGTSVMAAHRDTHFSFLKDVRVGDLIAVTRDDGLVFNYRATHLRVVNWDQSGIDAHAAGFHLALVTCYPFTAITHGPQRYVVDADLAQ